MRPQGLEDFDQQADRVISHHRGNDRRDHRIKPVKALRHVDDGTGHGDPGRSRGITGGIKKNRAHVQITTGFVVAVTVVAVTAEDEGTHEHHDRGNPTDKEHRQPVDLAGTGKEASGRAHQNRDAQDKQPARIYACGPCGGHRISLRTLRGRRQLGHPDSQQGHPDGGSIGQIVRAFCEHAQRVRRDSHNKQPGHQRKVQNQDDAQPTGTSHPFRVTIGTCYPLKTGARFSWNARKPSA
jgi:hypothetical protein